MKPLLRLEQKSTREVKGNKTGDRIHTPWRGHENTTLAYIQGHGPFSDRGTEYRCTLGYSAAEMGDTESRQSAKPGVGPEQSPKSLPSKTKISFQKRPDGQCVLD